jgi:hypothetical protein
MAAGSVAIQAPIEGYPNNFLIFIRAAGSAAATTPIELYPDYFFILIRRICRRLQAAWSLQPVAFGISAALSILPKAPDS